MTMKTKTAIASRRGFTIVELLVVMAISAMLAGIAITYSNISKNQIALSVEASKIGGTLYRTKDLAIATYNAPARPGSTKTCGYGMLIDSKNNNYSIFAFRPDQSKAAYSSTDLTKFCPSEAAVLAAGLTITGNNAEVTSTSPGTWHVPVTNNIKLYRSTGSDNLGVVLFYPPDPDALLSNGNAASATVTFLNPGETLHAYLAVPDGAPTTSVTVNPAGQIEF